MPFLTGRLFGIIRGMEHRHIVEFEQLSLAAIDDVIDRGGVEDWRALKARADADVSLIAKIKRICAAKVSDPYAQRYHLWNYYARRVVT